MPFFQRERRRKRERKRERALDFRTKQDAAAKYGCFLFFGILDAIEHEFSCTCSELLRHHNKGLLGCHVHVRMEELA